MKRLALPLLACVALALTCPAFADREACDPRAPKCPAYTLCIWAPDAKQHLCIPGCDPKAPKCPGDAPYCLPWPDHRGSVFRCYPPPREKR